MIDFLVYLTIATFFAISVAGFQHLFFFMIAPDGIFSKWQKVLERLRVRSLEGNFRFFYEFWYKSLGGCDVCFRQRWAEITYFVIVLMWIGDGGFWITHGIDFWPFRVIAEIVLYVNYCALVFSFGFLFTRSEKKGRRNLDFHPEDQIVRSQPRSRR